MCRKLTYLISFVLVLSLVGDVQAANIEWTNASGDLNWFTPANWANNEVPTSADKAQISKVPGPIIANEGAVADNVRITKGGFGDLTVDGGTLTARVIQMSIQESGEATVYMKSGHINLSSNFNVGSTGTGIINMTGGTITIGGTLVIGQQPTSHVDLDGGIINANNFEMRLAAGAAGTMDVGAGTLIINGDNVSTVQGYIDNGWITAYDGNGTLQLDYGVTNEGKTTLKATHFLNPNPADGSTVPSSVNQLQWTLPEPNQPGGVITCSVYLGTDPIIENDPKVVVHQAVESVSVTLAPGITYYWALDLYDSSISDTEPYMYCSIFTFFVASNLPPIVNAGADVVTWLADGARTGNLDATVTDDGALIPYTVQWTVVSEPNAPSNPDAVIADPSAEDTGITLAAVGEYVLQLEAFDGEYTSLDTITINVYNDSCQAAQSLPDYVPFPGDVNGDCIFDQLDLDILNEDWLKDNSLTEDWVKVE